jgi:hypothetical protein
MPNKDWPKTGIETMKFKQFVASIALSMLGASAMAASPSCTSTTGWGSLGPPGFEVFGNSFTSANNYTDCYTFSLSGPAISFGGAVEINTLFNKLDIDVQSVSLYVGDTLVGVDTSPLFFSFAGLSGVGSYTLAIASKVTTDPGLWTVPVGYAGLITTIAAPVPEPGALALMVAGLAGVGGVAAWRRRKA